ncbi:MAG: serine hydrolase [Algibacter sp.]|uniref:serine hydrolase domain-containing protein n=1 Tax=Algibacter sp. TaxID=1872428 RepID=UPI00329956D0
MNKLTYVILILVTSFLSCSTDDAITKEESNNNATYFPPLNSNSWETTAISDLDWNENHVQPLLDFLEEKNTKSFIILHHGKIALEAYFNNHDDSKLWYWASAGKTLTTTVSGIAQEEGLINLDNKVSEYLGTGWTSATLDQENLITCKHLLSMTSGLDDSLGDDVSPENLQYLANAGSRWAYHNVYVKMQDIISTTSNQNWSDYFNSKLRDKIGMTGQWINLGSLSVYWSNTRSMARFGLLIAAQGTWEDAQIISPEFLTEAANTSQNINKSYGYLWWLNGKDSYHLPQSQLEFNGKLIPNAPNDMYAALGKNDQKIYIIPSKDLVIIRMGEAADGDNFALSSFDNDLWEKLNAVIE